MRDVGSARDGWGSDLRGLEAGEAAARGISVIGTLGVLRLAKGEGLIAGCGPLLREMQKATGAWMGEELVRRFLEDMGEVG